MTKQKAKVLLFGSMGDIAETAREALSGDGYEVTLFPFAQNLLRDECGFRRGLMKAIGICRPDVVLPVGNTVAIARIKASTPGLPQIIVDRPENVELLDSKISAAATASGLGIPLPKIFDSIDEAKDFPVIFKRDISFAGSGVYKPSSAKALASIAEHFAGKAFIVEEYVDGCDWSVDAIRSDGYFRCGCYRSLANKGQGPSIIREACDNTLLGEYAEKMLDAVGYHGVCGMDFRVDGDGRPFFLECNPRLTGGLQTQLKNGFNIPSILVRLSLESKLP